MNKCILIGNLVRDPEFTSTASGVSVCKFCIAVRRAFKNANSEQDSDFLNIVTWRGLADNCSKYLSKGSKVAVCGQIQTRTWDKDGEKRYVTEIIADDVEFLSRANESGEKGTETAQKGSKRDLKPVDDDDLPF